MAEYNKKAIKIIIRYLSFIFLKILVPIKPPIIPPIPHNIPDLISIKLDVEYINAVVIVIGKMQKIVLALASFSDNPKKYIKQGIAINPPPEANIPLHIPVIKPINRDLNIFFILIFLVFQCKIIHNK